MLRLVLFRLDLAENDLRVIGYKDDLVFPSVDGFQFLARFQRNIHLFQNNTEIAVGLVLSLLENVEVTSGIEDEVIDLFDDELADFEHSREFQKVVETTVLDQLVVDARIEIEYKDSGVGESDCQEVCGVKGYEFDILDCACRLVERAVICDVYRVGDLLVFVEFDDTAVPT